MEKDNKKTILHLSKKWKVSIIIFFALIIAVSIGSSIYKRESLKNQLEIYLSEEYGLTDITISTKRVDSCKYIAYVTCSGMDSLSYEEMTKIAYYYDIDGMQFRKYQVQWRYIFNLYNKYI